jgi:hypothetical protein
LLSHFFKSTFEKGSAPTRKHFISARRVAEKNVKLYYGGVDAAARQVHAITCSDVVCIKMIKASHKHSGVRGVITLSPPIMYRALTRIATGRPESYIAKMDG